LSKHCVEYIYNSVLIFSATGNGQRATGNGQRATGNGQWATGNGLDTNSYHFTQRAFDIGHINLNQIV